MATIKKKLFGDVVGRYGDWVGRIRHGKYYIASRPSKYTMSKKPHEVDKRNRFRVNGKFAKAIKENQLLYNTWYINRAPADTAYNKICKENFKHCGTERPAITNFITPPGGFDLKITSVQSFNNRVEVELVPFNLLENEKSLNFAMIVCFYEPVKNTSESFIIQNIQNYELNDLHLTFNFDSREIQIAGEYNKRIIYLAAVTENAEGKIVRWSQTVSREA